MAARCPSERWKPIGVYQAVVDAVPGLLPTAGWLLLAGFGAVVELRCCG